jgi:DNA invertase Pin-like site-specific DNA recombinase
MNVAIYRRVSTKAQTEGFSLAEQLDRLVALAESSGAAYEDFCDPGRSGETLEGRPAMTELLSRLGDFDAVLVVDDSRLARNEMVAAVIREKLRKSDTLLITPSGEIDLNDPSAQFASGVLGLASQLEQRLRSQKSVAALRRGAEAGYWPGGPPPFGYRLAVVDETSHKKLVIDEDEARFLKAAVKLILEEGHSTYSACAELNARGFRTRREQHLWQHPNLCHQLRKQHLTGTWIYNQGGQPIAIPIPAILTEDEWDRLQRAIKGTPRPLRKQRFYPLSGRSGNHLHCQCGGQFTGLTRSEKDNRPCYRCNRTEAHWGTQRYTFYPRTYRAIEIERAVWDQVEAVLSDEDYLLSLAVGYLSEQRLDEDTLHQRGVLELEADRLRREQKAIVRELAVTERLDLLNDTLEDVDTGLEEVEAKLENLPSPTGLPDVASLESAIRALTASARERLTNPSPGLMAEVFALFEIDLHRVAADRFEGTGILPIPDDEFSFDGLLNGDVRKGGLRGRAPRPPRSGRGAVGVPLSPDPAC